MNSFIDSCRDKAAKIKDPEQRRLYMERVTTAVTDAWEVTSSTSKEKIKNLGEWLHEKMNALEKQQDEDQKKQDEDQKKGIWGRLKDRLSGAWRWFRNSALGKWISRHIPDSVKKQIREGTKSIQDAFKNAKDASLLIVIRSLSQSRIENPLSDATNCLSDIMST